MRINGTEYAADTNSFDLSQYESAGELSVMVRADGANNSLWSDAKPLRYLAMSGALVYAANTLTWNPVIGATYYEVQVNEGEIIRISDVGTTSAAIALTQAGWNTLRVRFGGEDGLPSEWAETRVFAYEIAFDTRGGTAVESVFAAYGDAVTLPVPASDAYDFEGWYNIPSGTVNNGALYEDAVFEERNDILLYASWRRTRGGRGRCGPYLHRLVFGRERQRYALYG